MDLSLNETQRTLQNSVSTFMQREAPRDALVSWQQAETGIPPELWSKIAKLGWLQLLIPPEYGGNGNSLTDAAVVFEQLGRGPLAGPLFSSGVLGALMVHMHGTEAQRRRWLPRIGAGHDILTLAINEPLYAWGPNGVQMTAQRTHQGYCLAGMKVFVSDGMQATHVLLAARTAEDSDGVSWFFVDKRQPGITVQHHPGFLAWQSALTLDHVEVDTDAVLGQVEGYGWRRLEQVLEKALPILGAYQAGACAALFEMSVEHSRTRVQFGVPIGRFQRVQDHIIRQVNAKDAAYWAAYETLSRLDSGRPARAQAFLVKAVAAEAYVEACNAAHEVFAGIGSDPAFGLTLHTRMSRTLFHYLGGPQWYKRQMADALGW